MKNNYLLTPGPTPLPPYVLESLSKQIIHHRTPQFQKILKETEDGLRYIFQTQNDVFILASSGTGAMEAAVCNIVNKGDKVLVIEGGKFGERWVELCKIYGAEIILLKVEWGKAVDPDKVKEILNKDNKIKAVFCTHCETSTAVANDIRALGKIVKNTDAVLIIDAISSLGSLDLRTDQWFLDVVVSGSQKGLMLPPGLGLISLSPKAWKFVENCTTSRYYFDLRLSRKALASVDTPFTPAIDLIIALNEVLKNFKKEGLDNIFLRNKRLAFATSQAMKAIGLEIYALDTADSLTAVKVPDGIDGEKLVKTMRDVDGVVFAGGQSQLKGRILRIAHMGYIRAEDLRAGIKVLEENLLKMGHEFQKGIGLEAFESALAEFSL